MTIPLGGGGSLTYGTNPPVSIPSSTAPQNQLQQDSKIIIQSQNSQAGDTYMFLASSFDNSPGFLSAKIDTNQFNITTNKLTLIGFNGLDSDDLTEGSINLFLSQVNFDSFFNVKTTDDLPEGTNKYYATSLFNSDFATKSTTNLAEGTNLYFTNARAQSALSAHTGNTSIHLSDLTSFTTDDLAEGLTNLYLTSAILSDIVDNTTARHSHSNKSTLDTYNFTNANALSAISQMHSHSNKSILDNVQVAFTTAMYNKYEAYTSNLISSALAPLSITDGVLSHASTDGNKHVPSNSGASQYHVLSSGASAGTYNWQSIDTIIANSSVLEASPSVSTVKAVQSAYINTHVSNGTSNVKHVTDANLTYINTTIPAHIASTLLHVPAFTNVTDRGKFLYINNSDILAWTTTATNIQTSGTAYISASGDTITAVPIRLMHTAFIAGENITLDSGTDTISASWRPIDATPVNGNTTTSISSDWAYDHNAGTGNSKHVPAAGTSGHFLAWDGTFKDPASYMTNGVKIYKVTLGAGGSSGDIDTRLASSDTDYPVGWTLAKDTVTTDLDITHSLSLELVDVSIYSDDGTDKIKLMNTAAYSTISSNSTNTITTIYSLATINQKIHIYLQFK